MFEVTYINNNIGIFKTYQELINDKNFNDIIELFCINNQITSLDFLPVKLIILYCNDNQITSLDKLPNSLTYLVCNDNQITSLDNLIAFDEGVRNPTELDFLPNSLEYFACDNNQITSLDNLPNNLEFLNCNNNQITSLDNLIAFDEGVRNPTELDFLPNSLLKLSCNNNQITSLDNLLLSNLKYFNYENNPICEIVKKFFDRDLKKYNLWKRKYLKKFILKIENWFLECKYNPEYKYCQKFVIEGYNFYKTKTLLK